MGAKSISTSCPLKEERLRLRGWSKWLEVTQPLSH